MVALAARAYPAWAVNPDTGDMIALTTNNAELWGTGLVVEIIQRWVREDRAAR